MRAEATKKGTRVCRVSDSSAAAVVVSVAMFMMWLVGHEHELGRRVTRWPG